MFGMPPHRESIAQSVYYADSDLCNPIVNTTKGYPQREMEHGKMKPWPSPYILMADRGGCTFTKKVRNAQLAGAAAVLIADNLCLCSDVTCTNSNPSSFCESEEPIVADDGSGADISIPSFLIFKSDADVMKAEVKANRPVLAQMTIGRSSPIGNDNRVEYELWTSPGDPLSMEFLSNFKKVAVALGSQARFTPHMLIRDGIRSRCEGPTSKNRCNNLCTNHGRYCATSPNSRLSDLPPGADVVKESLRQLCIWQHYGSEDGIGVKWWDYMAALINNCTWSFSFSNPACIHNAYKRSGVDVVTIERCMVESGGVTSDAPNSKLEKEISIMTSRGVVAIPKLQVDAYPVSDAVTSTNVFSAICANFAEQNEPKICSECVKCPEIADCLESGICRPILPDHSSGCGTARSSGVSVTTVVVAMVVVAVVVAFTVWHYKRTKDSMLDQVRAMLSEQEPLMEDDEEADEDEWVESGNVGEEVDEVGRLTL